jgi:hypothetical protein
LRFNHLKSQQRSNWIFFIMSCNCASSNSMTKWPGLQLRLLYKYNGVWDSAQIIIAIAKISKYLRPLHAILNMHASYDYIQRHV